MISLGKVQSEGTGVRQSSSDVLARHSNYFGCVVSEDRLGLIATGRSDCDGASNATFPIRHLKIERVTGFRVPAFALCFPKT